MGSSPAVDRRVVDLLARFPARGACTDAERRAAAALHDDLRAHGHEAWVETRWTRPQANASLALHAALAVAASLASVALALPAAIAAGVAALSLAVEAAGRTGPLRLLLPRRATQHVLTVPPGDGITLVLAARYDAPPARGVGLRRLAGRLPGRPLGWIAACALLVAGAAAARVAGLGGDALGAAQLVPTLVLLGALAVAVEHAGSAIAEGANDNASGVAVAVALYEELRRLPPAGLAPALLLHGAGAPGPQALRAHLHAERLRPGDAVVIEVGPSGAGAPAFASRHRELRAAAQRAAAALELAPARRGVQLPAGTGRLPAIAIGADQPAAETVDPAAMEAVLDLALAVVDAVDAGLGLRPARSRAA
jgi:hypothetical protein